MPDSHTGDKQSILSEASDTVGGRAMTSNTVDPKKGP